MEFKKVRISSTKVIQGSRILYEIGEIQAASAWHPENMAARQQEWREHVLRQLILKAEDIDADAIVGVDIKNDAPFRNEETGVNLNRVIATGTAVKLSCAA